MAGREALPSTAVPMGGDPGRTHRAGADAVVSADRRDADATLVLEGGRGDVHPRTPPPGIEFDTLDAGRHAVHRLVGPHEEIGEAYRRLFEEWLPASGETVAGRPCMELYRNTVAEVVAKRLITDLCVPLLEPDPD